MGMVNGHLYTDDALTVLVEVRMRTVNALNRTIQRGAKSVFLAKVVGHAEVEVVRPMVPPTFLRNDLELLGNGTPSLLACLKAVPLVELLLGVVEESEGHCPVVFRALYSGWRECWCGHTHLPYVAHVLTLIIPSKKAPNRVLTLDHL